MNLLATCLCNHSTVQWRHFTLYLPYIHIDINGFKVTKITCRFFFFFNSTFKILKHWIFNSDFTFWSNPLFLPLVLHSISYCLHSLIWLHNNILLMNLAMAALNSHSDIWQNQSRSAWHASHSTNFHTCHRGVTFTVTHYLCTLDQIHLNRTDEDCSGSIPENELMLTGYCYLWNITKLIHDG